MDAIAMVASMAWEQAQTETGRRFVVLFTALTLATLLQFCRSWTDILCWTWLDRLWFGGGYTQLHNPPEDTHVEEDSPANAQQQKQLMLKDTAQRVNAWGQKLRSGVTLTKIEASDGRTQSQVNVRLVRKKLRNSELMRESLQVGEEEIQFPLGKDSLRVEHDEDTNRILSIGRTRILLERILDRFEFVLTLRVLSQQGTKAAEAVGAPGSPADPPPPKIPTPADDHTAGVVGGDSVEPVDASAGFETSSTGGKIGSSISVKSSGSRSRTASGVDNSSYLSSSTTTSTTTTTTTTQSGTTGDGRGLSESSRGSRGSGCVALGQSALPWAMDAGGAKTDAAASRRDTGGGDPGGGGLLFGATFEGVEGRRISGAKEQSPCGTLLRVQPAAE